MKHAVISIADADKRTSPPEERIALELEEDIIFGRLQPGERLREEALLERFGGTRHFIRRALARLDQTGIVVIERNRGASVRTFTPSEVMQVYEVRELLLRQAAMRIPLPVSSDLIARLTEINEDYRACIEAQNLRSVHERNDQFHEELFSVCPNEYLRKLVHDYMDLTLAIRAKNLADPRLLKVSIEHHRLMIKYMQGTDNWLLAELCVEHVRPSKMQYIEMYGSYDGTPAK